MELETENKKLYSFLLHNNEFQRNKVVTTDNYSLAFFNLYTENILFEEIKLLRI